MSLKIRYEPASEPLYQCWDPVEDGNKPLQGGPLLITPRTNAGPKA